MRVLLRVSVGSLLYRVLVGFWGCLMSKEISFEEKLAEHVHNGVLNMARAGEFTKIEYNNKLSIPESFVRAIWERVDQESLVDECAKILREKTARSLMESISAEISTDIKKLLANNGRREEIRAIARTYLDSLIDSGIESEADLGLKE